CARGRQLRLGGYAMDYW
nr:immunoglobulin heavy chain junction region [Mus musculus]